MSRAFLIGAGATKAEYRDAPLSKNFFKFVGRQDKELFKAIKDTIEPHISQPLQKSNVEDVMIQSYQFAPSVKTSFLESLYIAIYKVLADSTGSNASYINRYLNREFTRHPTRFKTLLNDRRLNKDDFFMTLNYDLYLDREVLAVQREIDYGLNKDFISTKFPPFQLTHEPTFSVYHLHGSLNWETAGNKINIHGGAIIPRYIRSGCNLCLIPPGQKELNPILKLVWATAEKRLSKADELIIIGCSLNPEDTELISIIKKFVDKKGSENIKIIYLSVSSDSPEYPYYKKIIGGDFREYRHGFNINGPPSKLGAIEFIFD